jgi:NADH-quinone oxidoreductase subunit N
VWLAVLGLLNSAVGAYYYLRILVTMYMHEPGEGAPSVKPLTPSMRLALILPAAGTLFLGIFPSWLLEFASRSAAFVK